MLNHTAGDAGFDARLRTMRVLWAAQLLSVGLFVLVGVVTRPPAGGPAGPEADAPTLLYALAAAGVASFLASFAVKAVFYRRAAERQEPAQAQTGLVLALALCEVAPLLGLVCLFVTRNDYSYLLFVQGALGMLMHFPRREQLEAAYYAPGGMGGAGRGAGGL